MVKKTQLIFYLVLAVLILSCNNKQDFNIFLSKLKKDTISNSLIDAEYLLYLRGNCIYNFKSDSIRIIFSFSSNCKSDIKTVQNVTDDGFFNTEDYNKEELESKLLTYVNLMLQINICEFNNIKKSYLWILFRLDDIDELTLPEYNIKDIKDNGASKFGVLVYDYKNIYVNLTEFSYFKPVEVAPKWYYYEVYFDIDCDCL